MGRVVDVLGEVGGESRVISMGKWAIPDGKCGTCISMLSDVNPPIAFHPLTFTVQFNIRPSLCKRGPLTYDPSSLARVERAVVKVSINGWTISYDEGSSKPGRGR